MTFSGACLEKCKALRPDSRHSKSPGGATELDGGLQNQIRV